MNSKELLSNGILNSNIIKLLDTEFIISHAFQRKRYFILVNLKKYNIGNFAGYCLYIIIIIIRIRIGSAKMAHTRIAITSER